jgi:hypothetical protein
VAPKLRPCYLLPCTQDRGNTAEQLASLALAGPASLAQARTLAADTVAPQLLLASRLGDLRAVLAHLRASDAHTAGPLAPYAAYLHLLVPLLDPLHKFLSSDPGEVHRRPWRVHPASQKHPLLWLECHPGMYDLLFGKPMHQA